MPAHTHELDTLLSLDGLSFRFTSGHQVKIAARLVPPSAARPHGIRYSLTLHDPSGRRIYGLDNAHGIRRRTAFDHRHVQGGTQIAPYSFHGAAQLLEDFYREVERILATQDAT